MSIKSLRKERLSYNKDVLFYFTTFFVISLIIFFAQNFLPKSEFLNGLFIPDVVNMSKTIDYVRQGGISEFSTGFAGVYFIYLIAWLTHPAFSLLINLIIIYYSIKFIFDIFVITNIASSKVCIGLIANPYLYLAVTGPNKEIPLIFATLYIVRSLIFKQKFWFIKSSVLSIALIFIRDGYGAILFISIFLFSIKISAKYKWKIGVLISFIVAFLYELVLSKFSIIERNILIASSLNKESGANSGFIGDLLSNSTNPFYSPISQAIRMIYNWLTLAIFPIPYTPDGNFYSLGFSYWLFGLLNSLGIMACIYVVLIQKHIVSEEQKKIIFIAAFVIFIWATTSISLYIQPRYLIPILPLAFGVFMSIKKKKRKILTWIILSFTFATIILYSLKGTPPPRVNDLQTISTSFLINKP